MLKLKTIFVRKPINYNQVLNDQKSLLRDLHTHVEEFDINYVVELSHEEYEEFKNDLLSDREFLKNHDGIFLVKEIDSDNYSGLVVDAQGFDYPRYVGIPMKEVDVKKCPRCSKYYTEPSAISRKDNKTEICSACGVEEALEAYGIDASLLKFLDKLQDGADRFHATITIQIPGKEDMVIKPLDEEE